MTLFCLLIYSKVTEGYEHRQAHEKSLAINAVFVIIFNPEVVFTNVSFGKKLYKFTSTLPLYFRSRIMGDKKLQEPSKIQLKRHTLRCRTKILGMET